mgnify:CR=1 FL=1
MGVPSWWLTAAGGIDWVKKPTKALNSDRAPLYEWFTDATVNTCWNAVDRHVEAGRGDQVAGQVSSQSLVRYKTNDYSVPVAYGYREVWVRAYVDQVVIGCKAEIIASHPRSYEREDMVFDPIHYLPLIARSMPWIKRHRWRTGICRPSSRP